MLAATLLAATLLLAVLILQWTAALRVGAPAHRRREEPLEALLVG